MKRFTMLALAVGLGLITAGTLQAQGKSDVHGKSDVQGKSDVPSKSDVPGKLDAKAAKAEIAVETSPRRVGPPEGPGRRVGPVGARGVLSRRSDLQLTGEQLKQLDAIARRYDDQDRLLRDDSARVASRAAERKEVNALLNEEQRVRAWKD